MIDLFLNARCPRNGRKEGRHSPSGYLLRWEVPFPWTGCALIAHASDSMLHLRFQPSISSNQTDFPSNATSHLPADGGFKTTAAIEGREGRLWRSAYPVYTAAIAASTTRTHRAQNFCRPPRGWHPTE